MTYVLHPGKMMSRNDGDIHYIGVGQLIELYRIPRGARMLVANRRGDRWPEDAIHCWPRYDGDYPVFEEKR
jgi:hypothetical protein